MCAYKPPIVKTGSGPTGIADIKIKGNKVRVEFENKEILANYIVVGTDKCPENLTPGVWYVSLTPQRDGIRNFRPINGMFKAKVVKITSQPDKEPAPLYNNRWDYYYFTVLFEIIAPEKTAGCIVPNNYHYNFEPVQDEDGKEVAGFNHPKSKYTTQLIDLCDATGVWQRGAMRASDNVLPELQRRMLKADKTVTLVLKDGFINSVFASEE
jgi:hypothetical protein